VGEGAGFAYDTGGEGYAGVSASSGIPTVLGWPGHQFQWRNGDSATLALIPVRQADVDTIYSTLDVNQARNLLRQYNVSHVYVGELERRRYAPESLAKFAQLGNIVFNQDEVTIYKISP
jgi:uncharacterized membrane protein